MKISTVTRVSRPIHALLLSAFLILTARPLAADEKDSARAEWMTGYLKLESGDKAVANNNVVVAAGLYKEALAIFENVQQKYPNWNPTLLKYRIAYCQQQIGKLEAKYQSDTSELSKEDLVVLSARQTEQIQQLTSSLDELKTRVSTLSESLGNMQAAAQKSNALEAAVATLSTEKKMLEDEAVRLNLRLKEALDQLAKLSAAAELQGKLTQAEDALRAAQESINTLKATNVQQLDAAAAAKAQASDLNRQLDDARAQLSGLNTAARANKEILDAQAETINKQTIQLAAQEAKLALAEKTSREQAQASSSHEREKAAMAAELAELRQFRDRTNAEREADKKSMSASADSARKEIQALSGEVAALNTQLAETKAQAQQLAGDLAGSRQQLASDRAKVITLEEARMNLLGELERTKSKLSQAETQNLKLVADVNALTVQQRSNTDSSKTLNQKIAESNVQLDTLRKEMASQTQKLQVQTALTTRQENVIAQMTKVIADNENSKKALTQQVAELNDKLSGRQDQLALLEQHKNTIAELNVKIQTLEAQSGNKALAEGKPDDKTGQTATAPTNLEKELAAYREKLSAVAEAEKKARSERDELEKKLRDETALRTQQEGAIASLLQQRRSKESESTEASKTQTDGGKLEQQLRELTAERRLHEQELSLLRQAREQQNLQLSMAKQQVAKLEDELRTEKMKAAFPGQPAAINAGALTSAAGSGALQDEVKALHQRLQDKDKQLLEQDKQLMAKERDLIAKNQLLQAMAGSEQEKVAWVKQLDELTKQTRQEQKQRQELEKALVDKEKQRAKDLADMENKLIQVTAELTRLEQERVKNEAEIVRKETDRASKEREKKVAINQALRQGLEAERAGNAAAAKEFYGQVLANDPQNNMALQRLGIIAASSGNDAEAIKYLEQSFKQNPDDADTLLALGTAMARQDKLDLAISMLSRAVAINDKNAGAARAYGMALLSVGWRDAAESQLKRAIALQPDDGNATYNVAVLMATSKPPRLEEARQWYLQALKAGAQPDPAMDALLKK